MNSHEPKGFSMDKVVLITGCSTGIGRALAEQLTGSGYTVVATARKVESLQDLQVALKLPLDITQPDAVQKAVDDVITRFNRIDVLVNNAGYAVQGAVEEIPEQQVEELFDANVFGAIRMIKAVVPHMRQKRAGRIINISSITGRLSTPVNGTYSATKYALEALSDALRWELEPFGIQVIVIEPGSIKTRFGNKAQAMAQDILSNPVSPYRGLYQQSEKVTAAMRRQEPGPEDVTRVIKKAIETSRPKARYLVGIDFLGKIVLWLGSSTWDMVVKRMFKITSLKSTLSE